MDSKKIGAFIAKNRKHKGLTQEQLGEKLGVSNKTVSRWENGNYMPDLSLLEPLSKELGITLNELLAGETINEEKAVEYSERNLIDTINYSLRLFNDKHKRISIIIIIVGAILGVYPFIVFSSESSWGEISSVLGFALFITGIFRELKVKSLIKKILICSSLFLTILVIFFICDYIGVIEYKRPPVYRYLTTTTFNDTKIIEYRNIFYNVHRIHADTSNEYYLIDSKKKYDLNSVPVHPFNKDKNGIENLVRYQSKYLGDNSNTGHLIEALPLSEYGFVFEIDSENYGLVIDYHFTDWYDNENGYIEKALVYDSISLFSLIDNLENIKFNFSGSSYYITRTKLQQKYPNYSKIFSNNKIDINKFSLYVEQKMNEESFITNVFEMFVKK